MRAGLPGVCLPAGRAGHRGAKLSEIEQAIVIPAGTYDRKTQVAIQRGIATAGVAQGEGDGLRALALMRSAADLDDATEKHPVTPGAILPAREQLGALLLALGEAEKALSEFETSLKRAPARLANFHGAAQAAEQAGQGEKAQHYFAQHRDLAKDGEDTRAEVRSAGLGIGAALAR